MPADTTERRVEKTVSGELIDAEATAAREALARARRLAKLMDSAFSIPYLNYRIGFDSLLGLIPGVGDLATTTVSALIVRDAIRLGVRKRTITRMLINIAADAGLGTIPLLGDIFDFAFKANLKNVALLERELARAGFSITHSETEPETQPRKDLR